MAPTRIIHRAATRAELRRHSSVIISKANPTLSNPSGAWIMIACQFGMMYSLKKDSVR
jgi:hypothetical protein